ncbi:MAG: hypothetical protein OEW87_06115 [Flavobacteriaceae bacterium]|nr:hypothetical protein [Flavobacteriaceae bacterium]
MEINIYRIPNNIFLNYNEIYNKRKYWEKWTDLNENKLWLNVVFCLLSSNVKSELAHSASIYLWKRGMLNRSLLIKEPNSINILSTELSKPIFKPFRKNGMGRKYRYPCKGASNIVFTAKNLSKNKIKIKSLLNNGFDETMVRNKLIENVYGFGLKQATHFLRNIGYSKSLAVIDTHIISFLNMISNNSFKKDYKNLTNAKYLELEEMFKKLCNELNVDLSIFDIAVWTYMREKN